MSKFASNIGLRELQALIQASAGQVTRVEGSTYVIERNTGQIIGTDQFGAVTTWLRVLVTKAGDVVSAYPITPP